MGIFRSNDPKAAVKEVHAAYRERITALAQYGVDSVEGETAEVIADTKAAAYEKQSGRPYRA